MTCKIGYIALLNTLLQEIGFDERVFSRGLTVNGLFCNRIKKVLARMRSSRMPSALLLSTAPPRARSRDTHYPYRQDSDLFYLTGAKSEPVHLLLSTERERPAVFSLPIDPKKIVWEGSLGNARSIARAINADLITTSHIAHKIKKELRGIDALYFQNTPDTLAWRVTQSLMELPSHTRDTFPSTFHHSDHLLEPLRLIKSSAELKEIREAVAITSEAMRNSLPLVRNGVREQEIAAFLEYQFRKRGCEPAFPSIVAAGPSAATLHYHKLSRRLKRSDLLLLDFGAEYNMYAADVSHVLPVSGKFEGVLADLYACVLEAQLAAIRKVKANVKIATIYNAAARILTLGLKDFKVLRGSLDSLLERKAYRPYFPHGIGHSLGIDVHDIGKLRGNNQPVLKAGMVFTVEPGLYFQKPVGKLPACGVRIEDDVVVRKSGATVLTKNIPKSTDEVEEMMASTPLQHTT